jgi:hypothetical protein
MRTAQERRLVRAGGSGPAEESDRFDGATAPRMEVVQIG